MAQSSKIGIHNSVTTYLIRIVFGIYCFVTLLVTTIQVVSEYYHTKNSIEQEMQKLSATFAPSLSNALWTYDEDALKDVLIGMQAFSIVIGVAIHDEKDRILQRIGTIETPETKSNLFSYRFPLTHVKDKQKKVLGAGVIYSNTDIVIQRVRYGVVLLLINAAIKTLVLWGLFLLFAHLIIGRPLRSLTTIIENAKLEKLMPITEELRTSKKNEFFLLKDAFNTMVQNFNASRTIELEKANTQLQQEINERKQAEEHIHQLNQELNKQVRQLDQSNKELDDFAYIASHDLKEPLRAISSYSQILLDDYKGKFDEESNWKLERLVPLAQRMTDLIDALLYYSRVGQTELAYKEVDLEKILDGVLDRLHYSIKENKIEIRIPQPMPTVHCDSVRVGEVFYNLISNAIKYNDKLDKWVEVGWKEGGSPRDCPPMVFYIRDNGIGIREKHMDSIFRIFKRLHGKDKFGGGVGAGLTFTKKIIENHKGRLWVESTCQEGTTFYFTLQAEEQNGN